MTRRAFPVSCAFVAFWLLDIVGGFGSFGAVLAQSDQAPGPFAGYAGSSDAVFNDPHDLTFGPDGRLYVADKFGNRIAVVDPESLEVLESIGDGQLPQVRDISFGPDGKAYVAVTGLNAVAVYDLSAATPVSEGLLGPFPRTEGALAHSNGFLYVMATGIGTLFAVDGQEVRHTAGGMLGAHDVEEGFDGTVWVADNAARRLVQFTPELEFIRALEGVAYGFRGPRYLAVDEFGRLVVVDQDAHRVLLIEPGSGAVLGIIGDGAPGLGPNKFDDPEGVAVRGNEFFISDSDNNRIVKYVVVVN